MSEIRRAAGQLLIFGFDGTAVSARLRTAIAGMQPGGVIVFARNIEAPGQTHQLLRECQQAAETPMFRCVDMEGGTVDRLKGSVHPAPAAADVFASGEKRMFRRHGRLIGEEVRALGFNTDFAPVFDLRFTASRPVLTTRTVSDNPKQAVTYAREFLRGLREARVLGCGKHFPGLGEANLDTHHELSQVHKSWKAMWAEDLYPYRALRREIPFVMVAHAAYPEVTKDATPASLSRKWMVEVLRKKIGYRGLVISDDLEMGGVLAAASIEQAAVETLRAGADIYLVCRNEEHVWGTYQAVVREAERDPRFARLIRERAARVLRFKKKSHKLLAQAAAPTAKTVAKLQAAMRQFAEEVRGGAAVL